MSEFNEDLDKDLRDEEFRREAEQELQALEPEAETASEEPTERVYTELERKQMALGWDPNKPNGVSAEEFERVGQIIEAKRAASKKAHLANKEVEELTKTVKQLVVHNKAVEKAALEKARRELEYQRRNKMQDGDIDAVLAIESEQQRLAKQEQDIVIPDVKEEPVISEEVKEFQEKHRSWLQGTSDEDRDMQDYVALKIAKFMRDDPNMDERVAIAQIEAGLMRQFPQKFKNPNKDRPAMVGTSTTANIKSSDLTSQLSYEDKQTLRSIQKVDPSYSTEEFIKQLELIGKLKK